MTIELILGKIMEIKEDIGNIKANTNGNRSDIKEIKRDVKTLGTEVRNHTKDPDAHHSSKGCDSKTNNPNNPNTTNGSKIVNGILIPYKWWIGVGIAIATAVITFLNMS